MSIIASNIPETTELSKIEHFFSFCGKISRVQEYELSKVPGEQCVQVVFANPSAVATALLLNGAELDGKPVTVREFNDGNIPHEGTRIGGHPGEIAERQGLVAPSEGVHDEKKDEDADIEQEHKPKSAIFAEYLSQGYVLGDQLVSKAVDYDKQHGFTDKFTQFVGDLDKKYKLHDKSAQLEQTQKNIDTKYGISSSLSKYFERAQNTQLGSKITEFYTKSVEDARQVHEEAKRLAELKKAEQAEQKTA